MTSMTNHGLEQLANLTNLQSLNISQKPVTDSTIAVLSALENLEVGKFICFTFIIMYMHAEKGG